VQESAAGAVCFPQLIGGGGMKEASGGHLVGIAVAVAPALTVAALIIICMSECRPERRHISFPASAKDARPHEVRP
jgi:hypothetical protein